MARPGGLGAATPIAALAAIAAFAAVTATAPFGEDALTTSLAVHGELWAQCWDEFGFAAAAGIPILSPMGATVAERFPYAHHPPVGWWPPYLGRRLLGKTALGYKLFPTLFTAASAALLFFLVRRHAGDGWAALGLVLFLALPAVLLYAPLPGVESIALAMAMLSLLLYERWRERPTRGRFAALAAAVFLGGTTAWSFSFLLPGLAVAELLRPRGERALRPLLAVGAVLALALAAVGLHLVLGTGSLETVWSDVKGTAKGALGSGLAAGGGRSFFATLPKMAAANLGILGALALPLAAAIMLARRGRDPLTRVAVALLVLGALNLLVFNGRSATHGYYWFQTAAGWALAMVQAARALVRPAHPDARPHPRAVAAAVAAALLVAGNGVQEVWRLKAAYERPGLEAEAARIDAQVPAGDWICCYADGVVGAMLHSRRRWIPPSWKPSYFAAILDGRDRGQLAFSRLLVVLDADSRTNHPEIVAFCEERARRPGTIRREINDLLLYWL